jgi:hypothetical protein
MTFERDRDLRFGYWFVAYLDLVGIRRAFANTNFVPGEDAAKADELIPLLRASVGAIRDMRKGLENYFAGMANADPEGRVFADLPPEKAAQAMRLRKTRVRRDAVSDGIVVACSLGPEDGHFPIRGVYEGIGACSTMMLIQLAAGRPIRGGLDVGTGIEVDDELFGAAGVNAYELESKRAQYPRLVVGDGLYKYLHASLRAPGQEVEREFERRMAQGCLNLLKKDDDDHWIVDYAGPHAHKLFLNGSPGPDVVEGAKTFARRTRDEFRVNAREDAQKLFERYSRLVRYLDAAGP